VNNLTQTAHQDNTNNTTTFHGSNNTMALFLLAKREKIRIFLEPNNSDKVFTVVDTIAGILAKNPDDVAICFQNTKLDNNKTLAECNISHSGDSPVDPISIHFIYKIEGTEDDWEEPSEAPLSKPVTVLPEPDTTEKTESS